MSAWNCGGGGGPRENTGGAYNEWLSSEDGKKFCAGIHRNYYEYGIDKNTGDIVDLVYSTAESRDDYYTSTVNVAHAEIDNGNQNADAVPENPTLYKYNPAVVDPADHPYCATITHTEPNDPTGQLYLTLPDTYNGWDNWVKKILSRGEYSFAYDDYPSNVKNTNGDVVGNGVFYQCHARRVIVTLAPIG